MKTKEDIILKLEEIEKEAKLPETSDARKQVLRIFYRFWKRRLEERRYWKIEKIVALFICFIFLAVTARPTYAGFMVSQKSSGPNLYQLAQQVRVKDQQRQKLRDHQRRVVRLQNYLTQKGSPLSSGAESLVSCGDRYLSGTGGPALLVGILNAESSLGKYYILANNPFNWGVHNGFTFSSFGEATCTVAAGLAKNYDLTSPLSIAVKYAPSEDHNNPKHWAAVVSQTMSEINL